MNESLSVGRGRTRERALQPTEIALVLMVLVLLFAAATLGGRQAEPEVRTATILVAPGDSLWSLAQSNPVPGLKEAETVELIRRLNGLSSSKLLAGSSIKVPREDRGTDQFALR